MNYNNKIKILFIFIFKIQDNIIKQKTGIINSSTRRLLQKRNSKEKTGNLRYNTLRLPVPIIFPSGQLFACQ